MDEGAAEKPAERKPQSQMTKQERRDLQEQQRAAKQAKKEAEGPPPAKKERPPPAASASTAAAAGPAGPGLSGRPPAAAAPAAPPKSAAPKSAPAAKPPAATSKPAAAASPKTPNSGTAAPAAAALSRSPVTRDAAAAPPPPPAQPVKANRRGRLDLSDLHPAILRLGVQCQTHEIKGGNARCIAMLQAFKQVIQDYAPRPSDAASGSTLGRDLVQHLGKPIQHLINCRKLSVSMGNAIAGLKHKINTMCEAGKDITLDALKKAVSQYIDMFIFERIVDADRFIAAHCVGKIVDGDAILTFGRSSAVEMILRDAKRAGKRFTVFAVDNGPAFEGKSFVRRLAAHEISCTYVLLSALSNVLSEVTKVLIGAAGVLTNGSVYSRIGTALVCLMSFHAHKPVLCCCETYKFTDKAWFNSLTSNEEGNPDDLMTPEDEGLPSDLGDWRNQDHLSLLNMQYDLTPPEYVTMLITEVGMIPPTSVPVIIREYHLKVSEA